MNILHKILRFSGFMFVLVSLVGCQISKGISTPLDHVPVSKMPIPEVDPVVAHFEKLDQCVYDTWTASGLPRPVFGVGEMPNNTGRFQASSEKTAGYQETLDGSPFLKKSIEMFGFDLVTRTEKDLKMVNVELHFGEKGLASDGKVYAVNGQKQVHRPNMHGQVDTYDIALNGQFTSDDQIPGESLSVGAWGAYVGKRAAASRIAVDLMTFDPRKTRGITTVGVASQVIVHDYQAGINRFLAKPMTILVGVDYGTTQVGMHDIALRLMTKLASYRVVATLNPDIAPKCNQYTGGFMTDNPGARYPEPLINQVMKGRVGPAITQEQAKREEPSKKAETPRKQTVSVFIPCGEGEGDYHCVMGETARVRIEDIKRRIQAGAEVKQIIGFTSSATLRAQDIPHGLTHAEDYARVLSVSPNTQVRGGSYDDLVKIHDPTSPLRGKSGVIIEIVENVPGNA